MAWSGYFQYAGQEFINVARTEAYAKGAPWFKASGEGSYLPAMLADSPYLSPIVDNAPWTDPDSPDSYDFWGLYPLDVAGIEDATVTSAVTESIGDGGIPGRVRRGTKTIVFNMLLLAGSDCGADYGVKWLRALLNGSACGNLATLTCNGDDLCYLSCEPSYDVYGSGQNPWDCLVDFKRNLRKVVFNSGPSVTSKRNTSDGGAVWTVTFTAVAGSPYEFGEEVPITTGFLSTAPVYATGITVQSTPFVFTETNCAVPVYTPVYDPLCPALIIPPGPPSVPIGCYTPPANWFRRQINIPNNFIPLWSEAVPVLRVNAVDDNIRNLRLRFYADVDGNGSISEDPCAFCGDIVISFVPEGATLVFDASDQLVYVETPGGLRRRADNLVFATDGTPFAWPSLSCGFAYIVTFDLPQTQVAPTIDLSLFNRVA